MRIGFPGIGTVVRHLRPEFARPVSPDEVLAAFHHPCAYAAVKKAAYKEHLGG